jgi:hypothetical protein
MPSVDRSIARSSSSSPAADASRVAPRSSRRRRSRTNERTNERGVRSKRLSRPVDGRRRRLRTKTPPAADDGVCLHHAHCLPIRIDCMERQTTDTFFRAFVSIARARTVDRRYRENARARTERRDPSRPRRRSVVRRRARRSPSIGSIGGGVVPITNRRVMTRDPVPMRRTTHPRIHFDVIHRRA